MADFKHVRIRKKTHRLINSRWPTIGLFDELADSEDELRQLFHLEMLANPRMNVTIGRLDRIPDGGIVMGESANQVMAAFVHCYDDGGRFNDGDLGAWYAALDITTAIEETVYHLTRRLKMSEGGFPNQMQMRELITTVSGPLLDLCETQTSHPELYDLNDYKASQKFARSIRWPFIDGGETGLRYDSVRRKGGINICVFKPEILQRPLTQGDHYQYDWNVEGEVYVNKLTNVKRPI